jgi:hypothetical protein
MTHLGIRALTLAFVVASALALGACSGKKTTTVSTGNGSVTVEQGAGNGTTTVKSSEGSVTVGKGAVDAASLGLPIYPAAKQSEEGSMSVSSASQGGASQVLTMTTDDSFDKVYAFYKAQMPAGSEKMKMASGGSQVASFQVGTQSEPDSKSVLITESNGKVSIQLVHAKK